MSSLLPCSQAQAGPCRGGRCWQDLPAQPELHRLGRDALSHTALPCSLQRSPSSHLCAHISPQPRLLEKTPAREAQPCAIQQGNQGAKRLPKLCVSYRSQKTLRLLNSTVASQESHEHHDSSDCDQDVDSCKAKPEAHRGVTAQLCPPSCLAGHSGSWGR